MKRARKYFKAKIYKYLLKNLPDALFELANRNNGDSPVSPLKKAI